MSLHVSFHALDTATHEADFSVRYTEVAADVMALILASSDRFVMNGKVGDRAEVALHLGRRQLEELISGAQEALEALYAADWDRHRQRSRDA